MLGLLAIIAVLLLFVGAGAHWVMLPALTAGFLFIAFWVVLLKVLIGFGRWLMGMPSGPAKRMPATRVYPVDRRSHRSALDVRGPITGEVYPAPATRTCGDPRCGRVNVAEARFCAQCGRPLGRAA